MPSRDNLDKYELFIGGSGVDIIHSTRETCKSAVPYININKLDKDNGFVAFFIQTLWNASTKRVKICKCTKLQIIMVQFTSWCTKLHQNLQSNIR